MDDLLLLKECKGERIHGSFQGRLVAELRHRGITKPEPATAYLNDTFIPKYAQQFGVQPRNKVEIQKWFDNSAYVFHPRVGEIRVQKLR